MVPAARCAFLFCRLLPGIQFPHLLCQQGAQGVRGSAQAGQPSGLFCLPHGVGYQLLSALVCWAMAKGYHWCCFHNSVHFYRAIAYILNYKNPMQYNFCPL